MCQLKTKALPDSWPPQGQRARPSWSSRLPACLLPQQQALRRTWGLQQQQTGPRRPPQSPLHEQARRLSRQPQQRPTQCQHHWGAQTGPRRLQNMNQRLRRKLKIQKQSSNTLTSDKRGDLQRNERRITGRPWHGHLCSIRGQSLRGRKFPAKGYKSDLDGRRKHGKYRKDATNVLHGRRNFLPLGHRHGQ